MSQLSGKDSANQMQNEISLLIFYADVQPILASRAKIRIISG